jgi:diguanylate cyclase (GGDEF)-like protein
MEMEQLRKEFLETERLYSGEKDCLLRVVNTLGIVVDRHDDLSKEFRPLKEMINSYNELPLERNETAVARLRSKIYTKELETGAGGSDELDRLADRLAGACRQLKRVMAVLLDDFYPLNKELKESADSFQFKCTGDMAEIDLEGPTNSFIKYMQSLSRKISKDFRSINEALVTLLEQIKGLEKSLISDFGGKDRIKDFEQFEVKVNQEVGSIVDSFTVYANINDIKNAVLEKIGNIRRLVARKRKEELKRTQKVEQNINQLRKRIYDAEEDAREMSKKAAYFESVATVDGLTGLFNRKAFDSKLKEAAETYNSGGEPFSLVIFDVDDFKKVNDTFGHTAGDKVLKIVAQTLKNTFRKNDFIARYGGDEFAVVIEGLSEEMARERIREFKERFGKKRFFSYKDGDASIGVSAGIALAAKGDSPEDIIHKSDMAMYEVKKLKGNRS